MDCVLWDNPFLANHGFAALSTICWWLQAEHGPFLSKGIDFFPMCLPFQILPYYFGDIKMN